MTRHVARGLLIGVCLAIALAAAPRAQKLVVTEQSFPCITQGTKVRNTYISHPDPAALKEAVRIFENHVSGTDYPVGTVLQLVPGEAMVKQAKEDFPNTNGWEFFALAITPQGTTITARGDQAGNRAGTCLSCHQAAVEFDYVCERTHGCAPVPLTDQMIAQLQAKDARCGVR
jgi:hypothetical protein